SEPHDGIETELPAPQAQGELHARRLVRERQAPLHATRPHGLVRPAGDPAGRAHRGLTRHTQPAGRHRRRERQVVPAGSAHGMGGRTLALNPPRPTATLRVYRGISRALTPLLLGWLWWRGRRESAYRQRLRERLG